MAEFIEPAGVKSYDFGLSENSMTKTLDLLAEFLPPELRKLDDPQTDIPRIAKDRRLTGLIESTLRDIPTAHDLRQADARSLDLEPDSVHLVLTSPPYWTLKEYRDSAGQLGHVDDYEKFLAELDAAWKNCFRALVPGGRLVIVVGDVCLSRRKNNGRHTVVPLHASIQEHCRQIGFDNLSPIIWHKIANAAHEVENGSSFLGKPYDSAILAGPVLEWRGIYDQVRLTVGVRFPFSNFRPSDTAQSVTLGGVQHDVLVRSMSLWDFRTGIGFEVPFKRVSPFIDVLGDVQMMTTQLSIDGVTATYTGRAFSLGGRIGVRYQVDHLFVALAAEATAIGPLRLGGTLQVGLGF